MLLLYKNELFFFLNFKKQTFMMVVVETQSFVFFSTLYRYINLFISIIRNDKNHLSYYNNHIFVIYYYCIKKKIIDLLLSHLHTIV